MDERGRVARGRDIGENPEWTWSDRPGPCGRGEEEKLVFFYFMPLVIMESSLIKFLMMSPESTRIERIVK